MAATRYTNINLVRDGRLIAVHHGWLYGEKLPIVNIKWNETTIRKNTRGEEFVSHIKCITEEERYAAKGSIPNGIVKKGEVKQESWVEMIKSILDQEKSMQPSHRNLLNTISAFSNVPRKKQKFINFVKSSSGGRTKMQDIEAVWDIIEKYKSSQKQGATETKNNDETGTGKKANGEDSNQKETEAKSNKKKRKQTGVEGENESTSNEVENGEDSNQQETEVKKSKKKRKHTEVEGENESNSNEVKNGEDINEKETEAKKNKNKRKHAEVEEENESNSNGVENGVCKPKKNKKKDSTDVDATQADVDEFNFEQAIKNILHIKPSISLKKLEKKFLKSYKNHYGDLDDLEKVAKKFNKKLKKLENVTINNDYVILAQ